MSDKDLKIVFAPGCFDSFEGTQDELDSLIRELTTMAATGELLENAYELDLDSIDHSSGNPIIDLIGITEPRSLQ